MAIIVQSTSSDDWGKRLLRITLAGLMLFHGVSKLVSGPGMITGLVAQHGLPPTLGYLVYIGEVLAPLCVLVGAWTRLAAFVIAIDMVVALLLVHTSQFFTIGKTGGWTLELQAFYLLVAIAIVLLGAGAYSIDGRNKRRVA